MKKYEELREYRNPPISIKELRSGRAVQLHYLIESSIQTGSCHLAVDITRIANFKGGNAEIKQYFIAKKGTILVGGGTVEKAKEAQTGWLLPTRKFQGKVLS